MALLDHFQFGNLLIPIAGPTVASSASQPKLTGTSQGATIRIPATSLDITHETALTVALLWQIARDCHLLQRSSPCPIVEVCHACLRGPAMLK